MTSFESPQIAVGHVTKWSVAAGRFGGAAIGARRCVRTVEPLAGYSSRGRV
jgi:hypothetical protein